MRNLLATAIAIGVGLVVLLGYVFSGVELLGLRLLFTDWAVTLAALAVLIGLGNLFVVHGRRVESGESGWVYSLLLVLALLLTLGVGIAEAVLGGVEAPFAETGPTRVLFTGVVAASQAALFSLIAFLLVAGAARMLRNRRDPWSIGFLVAVVIALVGWIPLNALGFANRFHTWLVSVPAAAGARGILLGVALGIVIVGLRLLTGLERPYND